jgi:hypothetical protein
MKRFILYILLVPIVGPLVTIAYQAVLDRGYPISLVFNSFSLFIWSAYYHWLIPALAIATADRFLPPQRWQRLGLTAAVGYVATLATIGFFWGLGRQSFLLAFIGAVAAVICCALLDEIQKSRLNDIVAAIRKWARTRRTWPD